MLTCNEKCLFVGGGDGRQRQCMSYILHYYPLTLAAVFLCRTKPQGIGGNQQNNVLFPIFKLELFKRVWFGLMLWICSNTKFFRLKWIIDQLHYVMIIISCMKVSWNWREMQKAELGLIKWNIHTGVFNAYVINTMSKFFVFWSPLKNYVCNRWKRFSCIQSVSVYEWECVKKWWAATKWEDKHFHKIQREWE